MPNDIDIPVVVHYMQHLAFPSHSVQKVLNRADVDRALGPDGLFNRVWAPAAQLRMRLHEVQEHQYRLADFGYTTEFEYVPHPESDRRLYQDLVSRFANARYQTAHGSGAVAGVRRPLDVFLFWKIDVYAGYAVPPRVPPQQGPRPGAVWLDTDCLGDEQCTRLFAHEVGHYLGLRHPCRRPMTAVTDGRGENLPACGDADADRLMGPGWEGSRLVDSELRQARDRAKQLFS
jgi:hypothetical protein